VGRLQTVSDADNDLYASLIQCFLVPTGVPLVLNTSYNLRPTRPTPKTNRPFAPQPSPRLLPAHPHESEGAGVAQLGLQAVSPAVALESPAGSAAPAARLAQFASGSERSQSLLVYCSP